MKQIIHTNNAPAAVGPYSQAVKVGDTVYISGQIPLTPEMELATDSIEQQAHQVFSNLKAVAEASGGSLTDIVKLTLLLTDMSDFATVNEIMQQYFSEPYPARACMGVKELPKGVNVECEAIMHLA